MWGPLYVCATLLWAQEGRVHCRVIGCSVCSPSPLSLTSPLSEALDETELLDSWQLAVWRYSWGCDNTGVLPEPPTTELTSLSTEPTSLDTPALSLSVSIISSEISQGYSNLGLLLGRLIMPPLTLTVKWLLGRIRSPLSNTGSKLSPKSENWNAILSSSKWDHWSKRMADKVPLIAACHHIITGKQVLQRYTLQTNSHSQVRWIEQQK